MSELELELRLMSQAIRRQPRKSRFNRSVNLRFQFGFGRRCCQLLQLDRALYLARQHLPKLGYHSLSSVRRHFI